MTNKSNRTNKIALILPAYNEELTVGQTIESFYKYMPDIEFVVVDNNSSDNTAKIALRTFQKNSINGSVLYEPRQGKGNAVRQAFSCIDADIYILCDADMTYPAKQAHELIQPIVDNKADMVVGDRHTSGTYAKQNKRHFHNAGNTLIKKLVNRFFRSNLKDIMSGYRAFNKKFVKNYPIMVEGFEIETDITLHALDKRFRITEIPIKYVDRPTGSESKLNTLSDGAKVLYTIVQILRHYRPLFFFGWISSILALLSLLSGIPVLQDWFMHQYIYHLPLAVLASALGILSIIVLTVGLILDSITKQDKMRFEKDLLNNNKPDT